MTTFWLQEGNPQDPRSHLVALAASQCAERRGHERAPTPSQARYGFIIDEVGSSDESVAASVMKSIPCGIRFTYGPDVGDATELEIWPSGERIVLAPKEYRYVQQLWRLTDRFLAETVDRISTEAGGRSPLWEALRFTGRSGATYEVGSQLGRGGTAVVFEVIGPDGRRLAAKALSPHRFAITVDARERFRRESEHLLTIDHPHVIRAVDIGERGEELILVTELATDSLYDRLSRSPPSDEMALEWLRQMLEGVAAIHAHEFIHRDITPRNLLFSDDDRLVLADFGTVRALHDATLTSASEKLGSLMYISLEQFNDPHAATIADDLFSVGQIAWELFAHRRPIANAPHLSLVRPDLDTWVVELVERLRSYDPAVRPGSAADAITELSQYVTRRRG